MRRNLENQIFHSMEQVIPTNESAIIASAVLNPGEEHPKRKL
jgi:hypothetical protein